LWTVTAIEPGSRKTAVVSAVTEPLILWEQEQAKLIAPKMEKIKTEREINSNRKAKLIAEASKMQDHVEREKIIQAISDLEKDNPKELICPVLWTGDVTPERLQNLLNGDSKLAFSSVGRLFRMGDRVMQTTNNYDKGVFNGDMGRILAIRHSDSEFVVRYDSNDVTYSFDDADQLTLAYAVTIHKSQGSEFPVVIVPILTQHYMMLQRNLLYTGMTRAKKLMILVGSRKAVSMAVRNSVREPRHTLLGERLAEVFQTKGI
ncbi:MAG: DUF3987 domain-containing protein, partial [Erysipelotrichia bacterium]|nr:DUF3987 domain-containing protein [Erysipelotrichia bacterium]